MQKVKVLISYLVIKTWKNKGSDIPFVFMSSIKHKNSKFHVVVVQWRQRNVQIAWSTFKVVMPIETYCFFAVLVAVAVVVAYALFCFTQPSKLLTEHAHFCLLADVVLVFQTIFTIWIQVFLNLKTIRKEEVLFNKLNLILITGQLVQQFSPPLTVTS